VVSRTIERARRARTTDLRLGRAIHIARHLKAEETKERTELKSRRRNKNIRRSVIRLDSRRAWHIARGPALHSRHDRHPRAACTRVRNKSGDYFVDRMWTAARHSAAKSPLRVALEHSRAHIDGSSRAHTASSHPTTKVRSVSRFCFHVRAPYGPCGTMPGGIIACCSLSPCIVAT
jgi:hypothetical protein